MFNNGVEVLEDRRLLSSSAVIDGLDVLIVGTNGPDYILVSEIVMGPSRAVSVQVNGGKVFSLDAGKAGQYRYTIFGKAGDDTIEVGASFIDLSYAIVHGGRGNDTISVSGNKVIGCQIAGEAGNDTIIVHTQTIEASDAPFSEQGPTIRGDGGNDTIHTDSMNDLIHGGPGDDLIYSGGGSDTVYGEEGGDTLLGGWHDDYLYGGPGSDLLDGWLGNDRLFGNAGIDTLMGDEGSNFVRGGPDRGVVYPPFGPRKLRMWVDDLLHRLPY